MNKEEILQEIRNYERVRKNTSNMLKELYRKLIEIEKVDIQND